MTESFGARLRRQRERRHITLAQIAASTKIKASLFEGLERDDVSKWPAGIFRRSFIRTYAEAIGLDPDEACREFVVRFPDPHDGPAPASAPAASTAGLHVAGEAMAYAAMGDPGGPGGPGGPGTDEDPADPGDAQLRLTLADHGIALMRGPASTTGWQRGQAVAFDLGVVLVAAISAFVWLDAFWMPLAMASVGYYLLSTLLLGHTIGVAIFLSPPQADAAAVIGAAPAVLPVTSGAADHSARTSLDQALEMRSELMSDAYQSLAVRRTSDSAADRQAVASAHPEDAAVRDTDDLAVEHGGGRHLSYPPLRPPVDIGSRRVRA